MLPVKQEFYSCNLRTLTSTGLAMRIWPAQGPGSVHSFLVKPKPWKPVASPTGNMTINRLKIWYLLTSWIYHKPPRTFAGTQAPEVDFSSAAFNMALATSCSSWFEADCAKTSPVLPGNNANTWGFKRGNKDRGEMQEKLFQWVLQESWIK